MKHTLIVAACAAGYACHADAQPAVALYGLIDTGILYVDNAKGHTAWQAASGDVTGSHWGLVGREDLSGGTKAVFELENGFSATNGTARQGGRLFGYQAYAGVSNTRLGTVTLGRQYDSVVDYLAALSFTGIHPGGNNLSAHPYDNDNLNNSFRVNNSIKYASVNYAGLKFGALYGFSNDTGFDNNRLYSFGASYGAGPVSLGAGFLQANNGGGGNTNGAITLTDRTFIAALQRTYGAGAAYAFGPARVGMVWTRTQLGGLDTINGPNSLGLLQNGQGACFSNYEINGSYLITPMFSVTGEYTFTDGALSTASGSHHPKWNEVSVQADYLFSKRTDVYLQTSYQHIDSDGSGLTANIASQSPSSNDQQLVVAVGLRHRF
ncbi:porin [Paraburkholderia rhizosphaerae]|uniref:Putative porin n=1 Tax=Paraburkholderia rhizosphaerae TaxID=480658 RepID=A0A4R8LV35_9BURK|nr:porin [Paraburkholderia rhizosphaerae]TDY51670.1 putative porin [Paraburkholderia rhizosphaerae]